MAVFLVKFSHRYKRKGKPGREKVLEFETVVRARNMAEAEEKALEKIGRTIDEPATEAWAKLRFMTGIQRVEKGREDKVVFRAMHPKKGKVLYETEWSA
jgi:hypothetical protein